MLRRLVLCAIVLLLTCSVYAANEHPLLVGVRLGETRFKDWRYGHREYRQQVNCVQFMVAVVEELLQRELTEDERDAILIKKIGRRKHLWRLIVHNDRRIRGIQTALVQMRKGQMIKPSEAKPGDFVQYWRLKDGRWVGHAAIILEIMNRNGMLCALVFGSHQSLGGVGVGNFEVGLNDPQTKTYLVRFKS